MNAKTVRQFYIWHKWTGLLTGLFLFVITLSGAVAVFKEEIDRAITPAKVIQPQGRALSLDELLQRMRAQRPTQKIGGVQLPERADAALVVRMEDPNQTGSGQFYEAFVDPYTGRVTGERRSENVANVIRQLHARFYYFGFWGRIVVGVFGLALLLSVVTGLVLYAPFMKGVFRQGLRFWQVRRGHGAKLFTSDWHKLIGIVSLAFNVVIAVTGAALGLENLAKYSQSIDAAIHPRPLPNKQPGEAKLTLEAAIAQAQLALPDFAPRALLLPTAKNNQFTIYGNLRGRFARDSASFVTVDAASGATLQSYAASRARPATKLYDLMEPLHFGNFAGVPLKVIYLFFGLASAFLPVTGFVLWWLKQRRTKRGRGTVASVAPIPKLISR